MRKLSMELVKVDGHVVWTVTDGIKIKFAWPRNGLSSLHVAYDMMRDWS